jgi:hypothetical protein
MEPILKLLQHPYLYVALLLIALIYRRQIQLQRKLFYVRIHSFLGEWLRTVGWGIGAGSVATAIFFFADVQVQWSLLPTLWLVAFALMLLRLRFVCFAYVIGLVGFVQPVLERVPQAATYEPLHWLVQPILDADLYSLFLLIGVLHIMESLLVRWQGNRMATPMFFMSKRGKLVGGYHMQRFWPVPLLIPGADMLLLPFPVVIGFSDMTLTQLPAQKAKSTGNGLMVYGLLVCALAVLVRFVPNTAILAGVVTIVGHEMLRWVARQKEEKWLPIFTNSSLGLKILAVLPNSPAQKLGILVGETIHKVNGVQVRTRQQLYEALTVNSAYCKLEVFNLDGQLKFLKRAMYQGEHHQLGIILAPDDDVRNYAEFKEYSLFAYLRWKLAGVFQKQG